MATDPRLFTSTLEDLDDLPFDANLRIPPLQSPIPFISSLRPPALEPTARVPDGPSRNATAKLTARSRALAEATPVGDDDASTTRSTRKAATPTRVIDPARLDASTSAAPPAERERKKQKLDYVQLPVQLPRPCTRQKAGKRLPPSFEPVPVLLNELHEPPPSAALFPPITPNNASWDGGKRRSLDQQRVLAEGTGRENAPVIERAEKQVQTHQEAEADSDSAGTRTNVQDSSKAKTTKRVCLRGRTDWTDAETECLHKGVAIHGKGKWKKILNHPGLSFQPNRTAVDLKDRCAVTSQLSWLCV